MSPFRRVLTLFVAVCAAVVLGSGLSTPAAASAAPAAPPSSTAYPPDEPLVVTVTNPEGVPGYPIEVVITGCVPGERVVVTIGGEIVEAVCGGTTVQVTITIPAPGEPGDFDVVVTFPDRDEPTTRIIPITVLPAGQPTTTVTATGGGSGGDGSSTGGNLPRTGSGGVFGTAWAALAVIITGAGLVVVTRRRAHARSD